MKGGSTWSASITAVRRTHRLLPGRCRRGRNLEYPPGSHRRPAWSPARV